MKFRLLSLLPMLLALLVAVGCDSSEDPNLLNPPPIDSTMVRVANLFESTPLSASLASFTFATDVPGQNVSQFRSLLITDRTSLIISRQDLRDTVPNIQLPRGARVTYFVIPTTQGVTVLSRQTSTGAADDLRERRQGRIIFINAVPDSLVYTLKRGCQSGDTLITPTAYATSSEREVDPGELSLFLFSSGSADEIASARVQITAGSVLYLVATATGGTINLFALDAGTNSSAALPQAQPETRTSADVELLNALADDVPISAHIQGSGSMIATSLDPLKISPSQNIQACFDPMGDHLVVSTSPTDSITTSLRLSVGSQALLIVFDSAARARTMVLDRNSQPPTAGFVNVRGVNLSPDRRPLSISIGSGSAAGDTADSRPFGSLAPGNSSRYIPLPAGQYSFLLNDDQTGEFLDGGYVTLNSGNHTLFITVAGGRHRLQILDDDGVGSTLQPLDIGGNSALIFNMMSDASATFGIGPITLSPIAYSYVRSTVIPLGTFTISVNGAANTSIDGTLGSYTIGATGSSGDIRLLQFLRPPKPTNAAMATVRFLNAATDPSATQLVIREQDSTAPEIATLDFGTPSQSFERDERKYSFIVTRPGDTHPVARIDGVELSAGRNYLLIVGPNRQDATVSTGLDYGTIWMQE